MVNLINYFTKRVNFYTLVALFSVSFGVYLHNLSPSVYGGDVGDLVSAIAVKGVPHPSGYPLFTILGIFFNSLPINQTPAWKVGLISVFSSSFSIVFFYLIIIEVLRKKTKILPQERIAAFIGALTLAFIYPFWLYSEIAEVFALNNFLILILFYLAILYYKRKKLKYLYLLFFSAGLSLSHHEIIILVFPSILLLVVASNTKVIKKPLELLKCFTFFLVGLLPYVYIPISASHNPPVNWDNAINFKNFLHLVLRRDYGWVSSVASNYSVAPSSLISFLGYLFFELSPILILISSFGFFYLFKKNKIFFTSFFLAFFLSGPFFAIYSNTSALSYFILGVLERFYVFFSLFLSFFFTFGLLTFSQVIVFFLEKLSSNFGKAFYKTFFVLIFFLIPLSFFLKNYSKTNLSNVWIGDYYAEDILSSLPKDSLLLLNSDTAMFNSLYIQQAMGIRKDIVITFNPINPNNIYEEEKRTLLKKKKIPKEELDFEVIESLSKKREIFSMEKRIYSKKVNNKKLSTQWIPYGLVFKLAKVKDFNLKKEDYLIQQEKIIHNFRMTKNDFENEAFYRSLTLNEIPSMYAGSFYDIANYLITFYKDTKASKAYCQRTIDIKEDSSIGYECLGNYHYSQNQCDKAQENLKKSIILDSKNKRAYIYLYLNYRNCYKNKEKEEEAIKTYKEIFKDDNINNFR